ncbi:unnamed protein product [Lactuca virosa]|uniref:Uncharacterized protein n=1 Tax=Lactuca virosa TaxID=75947 RepID=A0AAU9L961_9ASTR|nr:unnamed protein product [Lactuca virosa]
MEKIRFSLNLLFGVNTWLSVLGEEDRDMWSLRSRLTYCLALCATMLHGSAQVVVGSSDGTIHMFSVDYVSRGLGTVVEKYSGIADVKRNGIGEVLTTVESICRIRDKIQTHGIRKGVLTLWDLRFGIPVNSWQYSVPCPVEDMCLFVPPQSTTLSTTVRPLVYVAAGCNEVSLWNAENGSCHQVLRVANNESDGEISDMPWTLARASTSTSNHLKSVHCFLYLVGPT